MKVINCLIIMLCFVFFACAEKDFPDTEGTLDPVFPSDDVAVFFEEHLPNFSGVRSDCFFVDDRTNACILINSVEEFSRLSSCVSTLLPTIDFESYTLVIGQHQMSGTGFFVINQNLIVESENIKLKIKIQQPEGSYPTFCSLYFWGIYPKIQSENKSIDVNFIFQGIGN